MGIIKNRLLAIVLIALSIFTCATAYSQDCKMYAKEFELASKDFPAFEKVLNAFYASNYKFDFVSLKLKGGNYKDSKLTRIYFEDYWSKDTNTNGIDSIRTVEIDSVFLGSVLSVLTEGSFMQTCPYYSSSNNSYIVLLKRKGKIFFKCYSENQDTGVKNLSQLVKIIEQN